MLVILKCEEDGEEYTLLTVQPRVAIGKANFAEIPAGMLDASANFSGVAAKEMEEETGIRVSISDMVDLTRLASGDSVPGVYPSPGACDEFIRVFLYRQLAKRSYIEGLQGKLTGLVDEGEVIHLRIIPLRELWKSTPDAKSLFALCLYDNLRLTGGLPPPSPSVSAKAIR